MKKMVALFVVTLMAAMNFGPAFASNFSYCYSKEKGLDEACLARKNNEESYHRKQQYERENGSSSSSYSNNSSQSGSYSNNSGGRFEPIPVPQRGTYVLPGMR